MFYLKVSDKKPHFEFLRSWSQVASPAGEVNWYLDYGGYKSCRIIGKKRSHNNKKAKQPTNQPTNQPAQPNSEYI